MSLGGKNRKEVHDWCLENEFIALGYGDNVDHSKYLAIKDWADFRDKFSNEYSYMVESSKYTVQAVYAF